MPLKALVMTTVVVSTVLGAGFLLSEDNRFSFAWDKVPSWNAGQQQAATPDSRPEYAKAATGGPQKPPSDNPVGFMLAEVAEQYAQTARYPPWSVPLTEAQAEGYRGNHYEPVTLPLENGGQFTVTLEKFRFTQGESILVVATVKGPQVVENSLYATLERPDSGDSTGSTTLVQDGHTGYYQGILDTDEEPGEYRLIVEASIDGKPLRHVSSLSIEPYLGDFGGVSDSYLSNNNLVIPVGFSPNESGFYGLSAQLYNGQQPVAQLQAEKRLDSTSNTIALKAHGTVLANLSVSGPFHLRNLQIRQLPARPGDRTHYAFGPDEGYTFEPPDLDDLDDTPAANPESEHRAAMLKQLADKF